MAKRTGTTTSGIETSARYRKRQAERRRRDEEKWGQLAGPIILRFGDTAFYVKPDVVRADLKRIRDAIIGDDQATLAEFTAAGVVRPGT